MVTAALGSKRASPLVNQVTGVAFGLMALTFGSLHFAEERGIKWATPELRSALYPWFLFLCAVSMLAAWLVQRWGKSNRS